MQIEPSDPRTYSEIRHVDRQIVSGTVADVVKQYASTITFRPDQLSFSIRREEDKEWELRSLSLSGPRVLKGNRLSNERFSDKYDLRTGRYNHRPPEDVAEYVQLYIDTLNN